MNEEEEKIIKKSWIDAQHILENIMYRSRWSTDARDSIAEYLRKVVEESGGDYAKIKRKKSCGHS